MNKSVEAANGYFEERKATMQSRKCKKTSCDHYLVATVMKGRAASMGTAVGRAAVVTKGEDVIFVEKGRVLISRYALPKLVIGMPQSCAMATEYGSIGAIACQYARECGIPAVVGVKGLIETVKDGDLLRINGDTGLVEILKPRCEEGQTQEGMNR